VFDPLAVLLLIASQYTFGYAREGKDAVTEEKEDEPNRDDGPEDPDGDGPPDGTDSRSEEFIPEEKTVDPEQTQKLLTEWDDATQKETKGLAEDFNTGWYEENERIDIIGQNGNDGLHYEEVDTFSEEEPVSKDKKDEEIVDKYLSSATTEQTRTKPDFTEVIEPEKKDTESSVESEIAVSQEAQREQEYDRLESHESWRQAKNSWKEDNPDHTLKEYKKLYIKGKIDKLPWEDYINPDNSGYVQNQEQSDNSIWQRIQNKK